MVLSSCQHTLERTLSKLVAQIWMDDSFANRFFSEPTVVLQEAGMNLDEFSEVKVTQNLTGEQVLQLAGMEKASNYEIPILSKPSDLTDELLNRFMYESLALGDFGIRGST